MGRKVDENTSRSFKHVLFLRVESTLLTNQNRGDRGRLKLRRSNKMADFSIRVSSPFVCVYRTNSKLIATARRNNLSSLSEHESVIIRGTVSSIRPTHLACQFGQKYGPVSSSKLRKIELPDVYVAPFCHQCCYRESFE